MKKKKNKQNLRGINEINPDRNENKLNVEKEKLVEVNKRYPTGIGKPIVYHSFVSICIQFVCIYGL